MSDTSARSRAPDLTRRAGPVLLIPGLGLGAESWGPMVEVLAATGVLDRATTSVGVGGGYGRPRGGMASMAPSAVADVVCAEHPLEPGTVVIALSAGCQVAAHVALRSAHRIGALILIGPTTDPVAATWPRLVGRWFRTARFEPLNQLPVLLRQYRRTGWWSMVRAMNAARHDRIDVVLRALPCPVLVVRGPHDHIAPDSWVTALTGPGARSSTLQTVTLDAGAHMVPYTHGDLVANVVADFLWHVTPGPATGGVAAAGE